MDSYTSFLCYFATLFLKKVIIFYKYLSELLTIFQTIYLICWDKLVCFETKGEKNIE